MNKNIVATLAIIVASVVMPVQAGDYYISTELGINHGRSLGTNGADNDRASVCDGYINPLYTEVESTPGYLDYNCTGPNRGSTGNWQNAFKSGEGVLFSTALGYRLPDNRYRVEIEYFYRDTGYDEVSDIHNANGESGDKINQEIMIATESIDSMTSHNLFANVYRDFANDSQFTPYIGMGVGFGFTDIDYESLWARNSDASKIITGRGLPNEGDIRSNLAGTASVMNEELSDTLFGFQVMVGVDYELTESLSLGLKARWVDYSSFKETGIAGHTLRSHPPYLRTPEQAAATGGDRELVEGSFEIDDIEMFAVSLNLKYSF